MMPLSLMVSRTIPSLPVILSLFLGLKDIANTSVFLNLYTTRFPSTRHALSSVCDGNEYLKSLEFVLVTNITLLVPICITLAWMNCFKKKTTSKNGLMYIYVIWLHDFLLGLFVASPRHLHVHATRMKESWKTSKRNPKPLYPCQWLKLESYIRKHLT